MNCFVILFHFSYSFSLYHKNVINTQSIISKYLSKMDFKKIDTQIHTYYCIHQITSYADKFTEQLHTIKTASLLLNNKF